VDAIVTRPEPAMAVAELFKSKACPRETETEPSDHFRATGAAEQSGELSSSAA